MKRRFKSQIVKTLGGIGLIQHNPLTDNPEIDKYPWLVQFRIRVELPKESQFASEHPYLVESLRRVWGRGLSDLKCSSGDFGKALERGESTAYLGHIFAELFCLILYRAFQYFEGFDKIFFHEEVINIPEETTDNSTVYLINLFLLKPIPYEFGRFADLTAGYLSALLEKIDFPIMERIQDIINYLSCWPEISSEQ